jgi:sRNA-binding regulator protein Hfq
MAAIAVDKIIEAYVTLREQRSAVKKAFDLEDNALKAKQTKLEVYLLKQMEAIGSDQFKSVHGTAFRQIDTKVSQSDWNSFWPWMAEHERFDFMEKRMSSKAIKDYLAEGNDLPPGVTTFNEYKVVVHRA